MEPDRISLLLDNMFTAVEEGFSYDGIVSLPETGLEDAGKRPGLDGWAERRMKSYRRAMRFVQRALGLSPKSNSTLNPNSPTDSGHGAGSEKPPTDDQETSPERKDEDPRSPPPSGSQPGTGNEKRLPRLRNQTTPSPSDSPEAPRKGNEEVNEDTGHGGVQAGPSAEAEPPGDQVSPSPPDSLKLPRKKSEKILKSIAEGGDGERAAQPDSSVREKSPRLKGGQAVLPPPDSPKSPRKKGEKALEDTVHGKNEPGPSIREKSPRLREGQTTLPLPDSPKMPRKESKQLLGDSANPEVGQTPENDSEEATSRHPDTDQTELPAWESQSQRAEAGGLPRIKKVQVDAHPNIDQSQPGLERR